MRVQAFTITIAQSTLDDLRERLARTRWPDEAEGAAWDYRWLWRPLHPRARSGTEPAAAGDYPWVAQLVYRAAQNPPKAD